MAHQRGGDIQTARFAEPSRYVSSACLLTGRCRRGRPAATEVNLLSYRTSGAHPAERILSACLRKPRRLPSGRGESGMKKSPSQRDVSLVQNRPSTGTGSS